jgi:uncharacterized membrane protein
MHFDDWMTLAVDTFDVIGVAILTIGSAVGLARAGVALLRGERATAYANARRQVGHANVLGLEVLIIADIVRTVTIDQTAESALVLVVIVLVRTFLSFSLEIELEGTLPWRRGVAAAEVAALDVPIADGSASRTSPG